jgi:hypothetical protein
MLPQKWVETSKDSTKASHITIKEITMAKPKTIKDKVKENAPGLMVLNTKEIGLKILDMETECSCSRMA